MEVAQLKQELEKLLEVSNTKLDKSLVPAIIKDDQVAKVIVPDNMGLLHAADALISRFKEEEQFDTFILPFKNIFLNDVIITMKKLVPEHFGKLIKSPYGADGRPDPGANFTFIVDFNADGTPIEESGFIGSFIANVWEDAICTITPGGLMVKAKKKFEKKIDAFFVIVKKYMAENSCVKNKAVTIRPVQGGVVSEPVFIKTNQKIILEKTTDRIINNLIIPSLMEKQKKTLLFTGDFGTGKTETAIKIGVSSLKHRTFFYLHNSTLFYHLIPYIKTYGKCCVFVEDIDQVSSGDRDSAMNDLLNQMDGSELKYADCVFIFTTNNHDKIHPAMRRPGRIDQVVHFDYSSKESIAKIFELYAEGMTGADEIDYLALANETPENIQGAIVAEIAKRAVKYAETMHDNKISGEEFLDAIASMEHHVKFMREDPEKDDSLKAALSKVFEETIKEFNPDLFDNWKNW